MTIQIDSYKDYIKDIQASMTPTKSSPSKKILEENDIILNELKPGSRDKYKSLENESLSLNDPIFDDKAKENNPNPHSLLEVVKSYKPFIAEHVERRIQFFFMQLISCYKTGIEFESKKALHQGESAHKYKLDDNKKVKDLHSFKRHAAHSAVLPCLINKKTQEVFLAHTHVYTLQNSTIQMAAIINRFDMAVDPKLRDKALDIINQIAKANTKETPKESLKSFINESLKQVEDLLQEDKVQKDDAMKYVARQYQKITKEVLEQIRDNENEFFNNLLSLNMNEDRLSQTIGDSERSEGLKKAIYQIRYRTIRNVEIVHQKISEKIEILQQSVKKQLTDSRSPAHLRRGVKLVCLDQAKNKADRKSLEKVFCIGKKQFRREEGLIKNTIEKIKANTECFNNIQDVVKEVLNDMKALHDRDLEQRGLILREIRKSAGLTQKDMTKVFSNNLRMSSSTLSRIENGFRYLSKEEAKKICRSLGVDEVLLIPRPFYYRTVKKLG
ncbi:MAG: helix-turn-helix domain-containing protein [Rhabdochlamydiaceae bacterium]